MGRAYLSRGKGKTMAIEKTYKVQQKITLLVETLIEATSKKEAVQLVEDGMGDFDERTASIIPATFKVLGSALTQNEIDEWWKTH